MNRFTDQVVLITGGGSGIGRTTAAAFAAEGAAVVVAGRNEERLAETVAAIADAGGEAVAVAADVTDEASVAALVAATVERYGSLDVAFNNAGVGAPPAPLAELEESVWRSVLDANLTGLWLCLKHEMAYMRDNGGGAIVNVASNIGAHVSRPGMGAYAVSKAGVSTLTRIAALEGIADGVRVNAVSPGASDTPMSLRPGETEDDRAARIAQAIPLGRVGTRDEVASAVLWLASAGAGFAVGHDLVVDGGASA
ncbi:Dihydroanticapsin 7-dehydrogenase [Baekduia alba]|uniref:SDR family NAD(P)-dependent oxidoreductase n=1 Tax=Baekduia alba TaxID=2997333 RepID=UPI00234126BF|nr:glucose 1-dehydrogenase [Baekduia alba]WCB91728.1 Dihydroanticapsin 7-dehydrogenase [Baekduia alba]